MRNSVTTHEGNEIASFGEKLYDIYPQCTGNLFKCADRRIAL